MQGLFGLRKSNDKIHCILYVEYFRKKIAFPCASVLLVNELFSSFCFNNFDGLCFRVFFTKQPETKVY